MKPLTIKWRGKEAVLIDEHTLGTNVPTIKLTFVTRESFGISIVKFWHDWYSNISRSDLLVEEITLTENEIIQAVRCIEDRPYLIHELTNPIHSSQLHS